MLRDLPTDKTACPKIASTSFRRRVRTPWQTRATKGPTTPSILGQCAFPSLETEATSTEPAGNVIFGLFLGRVREQLLRPVHLN